MSSIRNSINLYSSPNILGDEIKKGETGRACSKHGQDEKAFEILVGNPQGNRPLRRPRRRWENNTKLDLMKIVWEGTNWIYLVQNKSR